jgi:hypothetical protein
MKGATKLIILPAIIFLAVMFVPLSAKAGQTANPQIQHYGPDSEIARQHTAKLRAAQVGPLTADNGEEIVFVLDDGIYVQFANGTGRRRLIQKGTGYNSFSYPAWSLDGTMLAFSAVQDDPRIADLVVAGADGSNPTVIATLNVGYYNSFITSISWHWANEYIMFSYWYNDNQGNTVAVICTVRYDGTDFVVGPGSDRFYCQYEPVQNSVRYAYLANGSPLSLNSDLRVSDLNGSNDILWWRRANVINGFTHVCWNNPNSIYTIVKNWDQHPGQEVLCRVDKLTNMYYEILYSESGASLWSPTASPGRTQLYCSEMTNSTSTLYQVVLGADGYAASVTARGVGFYPNWRQSIPAQTPPTVTTTAVTNIGPTSAQSGGNVVSQGSTAVTARGVCWSTTSNPTIANSKTVDGSGGGSYVSSLTNLTSNTTYHVRAYATNSIGTAYGADVQFTTSAAPTLPTVTTTAVTNITATSAQSGGSVTAQGSSAVTARGACWSTGANPTIANSHTHDGTGTGSYVSNLSGLLPGTAYHVRAYATNSTGTAYGSDRAFATTSGGWQAAQRLTWTSGNSECPAVAVNSSGHIHMVWQDNTSGNYEIYYKKSTNRGVTWTANQKLTSTSGTSKNPAIAVDPSGYLHVVWQDDTPGNMDIYYKKSTNGGASWTANQKLTSTSGVSRNPALVINASGHLHLFWEDNTPGNYEIYYKKSTNGGASWTANQRLTSTSGVSECPAVAVNSSGHLHLFWAENTPGNYEIYYRKSTNGGTAWTVSKRLTFTSGVSKNPAVAVNSSGHLHLFWKDNTSGGEEIYYKKSTDGGTTWTANQRLTYTAGVSDLPAIAVDSSGYLHLLWQDNTPGNYDIYYRKSTNGGTSWVTSQRLTFTAGDSLYPAIATDTSGNLHVLWADITPGNLDIYYRKFVK